MSLLLLLLLLLLTRRRECGEGKKPLKGHLPSSAYIHVRS
jgi:hypothetical protein